MVVKFSRSKDLGVNCGVISRLIYWIGFSEVYLKQGNETDTSQINIIDWIICDSLNLASLENFCNLLG
ncbi:hypothetical protein R6Q59_014495 [Mikania micrantha]